MNPELASLIERAQELHDDLELKSVGLWKEAVPGRVTSTAAGKVVLWLHDGKLGPLSH